MQVKTSELSRRALDWAVSFASGSQPGFNILYGGYTFYGWYELSPQGNANASLRPIPRYHKDWEHGGPIMEREKIDLETRWHTRGCGVRTKFEEWAATHPKNHGGLIRYTGYGPTPLIAVMRCYVASKLGDEIEIPDSLME